VQTSTEDESGIDELDCNFTLELETTTEDESGTDELDCDFTLELETTGDELEDLTAEEELNR